MQWADAVKVVARIVGDVGNSVVGVCCGERRRKRREVPDGEACTFGGVGRSHFSAQAQAEERKDRERLDWDHWYTIFT